MQSLLKQNIYQSNKCYSYSVRDFEVPANVKDCIQFQIAEPNYEPYRLRLFRRITYIVLVQT